MKIFLIIILLIAYSSPTSSARILGIIPTPSYSHQIAFRPIWKELARKGHEVLLLTTHPMNDSSLPNLKEIDLSFAIRLMDDLSKDKDPTNFINFVTNAILNRNKINEMILQREEVRRLISNESERFDLLMIEYALPSFLAFGHRFRAPIISLTSFDGFNAAQDIIGGFSHPILYPEPFGPKGDDLSFLERLAIVGALIYFKYLHYTLIAPLENETVRRHFGEGYPDVGDLQGNVHMLFSYTNLGFHKVRPTVPANVFISGLHIEDPSPLPKELQNYLDEAEAGVVYFNLGTSVKNEDIPRRARKIILAAFAELPFRVLWKFELEDLREVPGNVKVVGWAPQQDVLRHEKTKVFVTQGGLQSIEEALYIRVPMVVLPVEGDQRFNAENVVQRGFGLSLDVNNLQKDEFIGAIMEVMNNLTYQKRVEETADQLLDQPMTSLERAMWWTEYVIRHKGAKHLKGPSVDLPNYKYFLLDVMGFCISALVFIIFIVIITIRFIISKLKPKRYFGKKID